MFIYVCVYQKAVGEADDEVDDDGDGSEFELAKMARERLSDEKE